MTASAQRRVAIACQGGGSQCAFVAGALSTLFASGVQHRHRIVGLSGTSGGALTAAVAWLGLLRQLQGDTSPIENRITALWDDLTAQTPNEIALDAFCVQSVRLAERGLLPSFAMSPSSLAFQMWSRAVSTWIGRPEFTDLRAVVNKHIDFAALPTLLRPDSPLLLVGAGDVLAGDLKVFSSARGEIKSESVLASAAIPNLFPAVRVDGSAYWDGIFASNPPVTGFFAEKISARREQPHEVWIIQVNPWTYDDVPEDPAEISSRRNHLAGNLSLRHELLLIQVVNLLLREGDLTDEVRKRFGFGPTHDEISVRFIRMSPELQASLDHPSKLSRQPSHIARLMADGVVQARAFLQTLPSYVGVRGESDPAERSPSPGPS